MSRKIKFRMWDKDYKEMRIFGKNPHDDFRTNRNNELYYYLQRKDSIMLKKSNKNSVDAFLAK